MEEYLASLERLRRYDVDVVLPGHGPVFQNCRERISELEAHHRQRANDVLSALAEADRTAYQVASRIPWSVVDDGGWDTLPLLQKFFAAGEAFSHLKYLEERGYLLKEMRDSTLVYSLVKPAGDCWSKVRLVFSFERGTAPDHLAVKDRHLDADILQAAGLYLNTC